MRFIVLSSSRGTTFQAILDRIADGELTAECLGLVSDRPDRGCVEKAEAATLPVRIVERREGDSKEEYDHRIHDAFVDLIGGEGEARDDVLIAAIGWMYVLTAWFIERWRNRILNVHPALLPKYGGEGMYGLTVHEAVLRAREKESGITIHLVDEGVDTGKIILQEVCPVLPKDTPETLKARVQELEREWYPKVLQMIQEGEIKLP